MIKVFPGPQVLILIVFLCPTFLSLGAQEPNDRPAVHCSYEQVTEMGGDGGTSPTSIRPE